MTPAPVDHDAQRARLAAVVLDIVAERGLEAASVRAIADAAGVSIGTVQHYFPTKDELLLYTFVHIGHELDDRVERIVKRAWSGRRALRAILLELLPLDARRRAALRVSIAFATRAINHPVLAAQLAKDLEALRAGLAELLTELRVADPRREAATVSALVDGLGTQLLFGKGTFTNDDAVAVLEAYLDRVFRHRRTGGTT